MVGEASPLVRHRLAWRKRVSRVSASALIAAIEAMCWRVELIMKLNWPISKSQFALLHCAT